MIGPLIGYLFRDKRGREHLEYVDTRLPLKVQLLGFTKKHKAVDYVTLNQRVRGKL